MSLALDRFPLDILSVITSYFTFEELRAVLTACTGSPLEHRIKNGGATHVAIPSSCTSEGLALLPVLKGLLSVSICFSDEDSSRHRHVVLSLPSKLLHLKIVSPRAHHLMTSEDIDTDSSSLNNASYSGFAPWAVSTTFSRLRSLALLQTSLGVGEEVYDWQHQTSAFQARFLSLLPASLDDLSVPIANWNLDQPLSQLLPNLTRLGGRQKFIPSSDSLPASMLSLDLDLSPPSRRKRFNFDFIDGATEQEATKAEMRITPELEALAFPPNLTRLSVSPCAFFDLRKRPALPTTLTMLTLNSVGIWDFSVLFALLPPSLTSLDLSMHSSAHFDPHILGELQPKPSMAFFAFTADGYEPTLAEESILYDYILGSFTCLRSCAFRIETAFGLQKSHIKLLNPNCLQSLRAAMSSEVVAAAKLTLPLLHTLCCIKPESSSDFDLSSVPPSTTELSLPGFVVPIRDLEKLPERVRLIHVQVSVSLEDSAFLAAHCVHQKSESESPTSEDSQMAVDQRDLYRLDLTTRYELKRAETGSSITVRPVPDFPLSRATHGGTMCILVPSFSNVAPRTLTDLRLTQEGVSASPDWLNSDCLPNLRKLVLRTSLPKTVTMETFVALESLHVGAITKACVSGSPPNLTSLKARNELDLPPKFLPLPQSIRKIRSGMSISPIDKVFPQNCRIDSFASFGLNNLTRMDYITEHLPSTLKSIGFPFDDRRSNDDWFLNLGKRFPSLEEIHVSDTDFWTVGALHIMHSTGAKIFGGSLPRVSPFARLVELAGGLDIHPDGNIASAASRAAIKAFPNAKDVQFSCDHIGDLEVAWPSIVIYLPVTLVELNLAKYYTLIHGDFLSLVPRSLKRLSCPEVPSFSTIRQSLASFTQLEDLDISQPNFDQKDFEAIPRSVKRLIVRQHTDTFLLEYALHLPPNLTNLTLSERNIPDEALNALPASLLRLECEMFRITPSSARALPPTLKSFIGYHDADYTQSLIKIAEERQMIWLGPRRIQQLRNDDYDDDEDDEDDEDEDDY